MPAKSKAQARLASTAECAYLAGLIDGEGCIGATITHDKRPGRRNAALAMFTVRISMCDREAIDLAAEIYGGSIKVSHPVIPRRSPVYTWQAYGATGAAILRDVLPYLRIKHAQAVAYLEARATFTGGPRKGHKGSVVPLVEDVQRRFEFVRLIQSLNGREKRYAS